MEFFNEDFFVDGNRAAGELSRRCFASSTPSSSETEPKETKNDEDYLAKLTSYMAQTYLSDSAGVPTSKVELPAVLKAGMRFVLSRGSPNGPWLVSSSFSTSLVERKREIEPEFYGHGCSSQLKEPSAPAKNSVAGFMYNPILTQPQLQAEQFYQLKQKQLIKQQLAIGLTLSSRSYLHHHHSVTGMKAVPLDIPQLRRPSAGTGVFLPKRIDIPNESHKKPGSLVISARVFQTLNLSQEDLRFQPRIPGSSSLNYGKFLAFFGFTSPANSDFLFMYYGMLELALAHGNLALTPQNWHRKQNRLFHKPAPPPPPAPAVTSHEIRLPTEWTY